MTGLCRTQITLTLLPLLPLLPSAFLQTLSAV
jgi:hypothetical protein